jgi:hypothetical protein
MNELIEHFTLPPTELQSLGMKDPHNQFGKALLLKFFQHEGRFPESINEIPDVIIAYVAQQLDLAETIIEQYDWLGRRSSEHRKDIREFMGFRRVTTADQHELRNWLLNDIMPDEYRPIYLEERVYARLRELHIEPPTKGRVKRLVTSAMHRYERVLFAQTVERLPPEIRCQMQKGL